MTAVAVDHAAEAAELVRVALRTVDAAQGGRDEFVAQVCREASVLLAAAQVHATLSLAGGASA